MDTRRSASCFLPNVYITLKNMRRIVVVQDIYRIVSVLCGVDVSVGEHIESGNAFARGGLITPSDNGRDEEQEKVPR